MPRSIYSFGISTARSAFDRRMVAFFVGSKVRFFISVDVCTFDPNLQKHADD